MTPDQQRVFFEDQGYLVLEDFLSTVTDCLAEGE